MGASLKHKKNAYARSFFRSDVPVVWLPDNEFAVD
jgi:hypothetical protein